MKKFIKDTQLEQLIYKLPKLAQRQYDTNTQVKYLLAIATKLGLYDAQDLIKTKLK